MNLLVYLATISISNCLDSLFDEIVGVADNMSSNNEESTCVSIYLQYLYGFSWDLLFAGSRHLRVAKSFCDM